MRVKAVPRKRGRAPDHEQQQHEDDGHIASPEPAPRQRRSLKRQRVGEPAAVERVRIGTAAGELLGFADILLCAPEAGSGQPAHNTEVTAVLSMAPAAPNRLLLTWELASGGPEVPVSGEYLRDASQ